MRISPCLLAFSLCASLPLAAWGRKGHEIVAALACRDLPPALAPWFQGREEILRDHCNDPDQWREHDRAENPRHFLNSEAYGGPAGVPPDRRDAIARLGQAAFEQDGLVPWVIQDRVQDLAQAFRAGDPGRVAYAAAILCHYVGDLSVPLHTTANHDGRLSGQHGVHHRWETGLVDRLGPWEPEPRPAVLGEGDWEAPFRWLQQSYARVAPLLRDDLESRRPGEAEFQWHARNSHYWTEFGRRQGPAVQEQLALAGQRTARMILLAWSMAGSPGC